MGCHPTNRRAHPPHLRYFFDVQNGDDFTPDEEGIDCDGPEAVRSQAIAALPEIARDALPDSDHHAMTVTVRDETGEAVYRASLTLAAQWLQRPQE